MSLTLDGTNGIVLPTAAAPAFYATPSGSQSVSATTYTKILFQTSVFDTNTNFASSRFTPTVAGYYQISWAVSAGSVASNYYISIVYKNGSSFKLGSNFPTSANGGPTSNGSALIYMNGSTDYLEVYALCSAGFTTNSSADNTWFNGCMVRSA